MVENKSPICELCGKHADEEPLGCKHYPFMPAANKQPTEETQYD